MLLLSREAVEFITVPVLIHSDGVNRRPDLPDFVPFGDAEYGSRTVRVGIPEPDKFWDDENYPKFKEWFNTTFYKEKKVTMTTVQPKEVLKDWRVKDSNGKYIIVKGILCDNKIYASGGEVYTKYEEVK